VESRHIAIIVVIALSCGTAILTMLINTWGRVRAPKPGPAPDLSRVENQIQSLQQSIDSIALEVERISEGQRFTTKLLSERTRERIDG
jgi:hypothetical protein